jgi:outer membrane lipoprotein-sorting protein
MKKNILILVLLLLTLTAGAQNTTQARAILDKTAAVVGHKGGATAKFQMTGKYGDASGTISIKGNKFCANTAQATVWYDGKTQWTLNKKNDEVNISTPTEAQQQAMNPYKFINIYKTGFDMTSKTISGGWQIHLTAQNQKRTIKELYITVNKSYQPTQVKMRNDKGWTTINLSAFQKKNLSDSQFRFNSKDHPTAEVIDLR